MVEFVIVFGLWQLWGCSSYFSSRGSAWFSTWQVSRSSHSWSSSQTGQLKGNDCQSTSAGSSQCQGRQRCNSTLQNPKRLNSCLCFQLKLAVCLCVLRLFISQHNCSRVFVFQGPASNVCLPWKDLLRTPGISMQHCCHWPTLAGIFTGLRTNSWILSVAPAIKLPFPSSAVGC